MASQRAVADGVGLSIGSYGTQKGDVYSFAIILHEILYRAGLFRCVEDSEPTPAKSKSTYTWEQLMQSLDRFEEFLHYFNHR